MTMHHDAFDDLEDARVEPFQVTPGFIAFLSLLLLPAIAAVGIYLGAWLVADDVYAAENASLVPSEQQTDADAFTDSKDVEGWKKALVGICPLH